MSKKTVTFKMPVKEALRRQIEPRQDFPADEEQTSPIAQPADLHADALRPDQWVRSRETEQDADRAPPALSFATGSLTIDLAAERNLAEVAALMLMVPPMLGWFWLFHVMNKYWGSLG